MKRKSNKTPKISLNEEGTLLECTEAFLGRLTSVAAPPHWRHSQFSGFPRKNISHTPDGYLSIEEGDFLLFLGCRHFQSKLRMGMSMMINDERMVTPNALREELFSPDWYTSLRFLHKEQIVKVDWHGGCGLDQLHEAASFLYLSFSRPLTTTKANR